MNIRLLAATIQFNLIHGSELRYHCTIIIISEVARKTKKRLVNNYWRLWARLIYPYMYIFQFRSQTQCLFKIQINIQCNQM